MKAFPLTPDVTLHVLIAGPIAARNEGLAELLSDPDTVVVDTAARPHHALLLAEWQRPDAVLLDIEMGEDALFQTISLLKEIAPSLAIIVLGHNATALQRSRSLEAGAGQFFDKATEMGELFSALQAIRFLKSELLRCKRPSMFGAPLGVPMRMVEVDGHGAKMAATTVNKSERNRFELETTFHESACLNASRIMNHTGVVFM